jgi:hypothetical protein
MILTKEQYYKYKDCEGMPCSECPISIISKDIGMECGDVWYKSLADTVENLYAELDKAKETKRNKTKRSMQDMSRYTTYNT